MIDILDISGIRKKDIAEMYKKFDRFNSFKNVYVDFRTGRIKESYNESELYEKGSTIIESKNLNIDSKNKYVQSFKKRLYIQLCEVLWNNNNEISELRDSVNNKTLFVSDRNLDAKWRFRSYESVVKDELSFRFTLEKGKKNAAVCITYGNDIYGYSNVGSYMIYGLCIVILNQYEYFLKEVRNPTSGFCDDVNFHRLVNEMLNLKLALGMVNVDNDKSIVTMIEFISKSMGVL